MLARFSFFSMLVLLTAFSVHAQYDDVYYDPNAFGKREKYSSESDRQETQSENRSYRGEDDDYWDEDFDDSEYEYSARIRRFHRPYGGFDYYDPCYVNVYFYDPFWNDPWWYWDRDIYAYSWNGYGDYWRWRRWNNFNRPWRYRFWNQWDHCYGGWGGWNNWGCNNWGWNGWNNCAWNGGGWNGGGWYGGGWNGGGWAGNRDWNDHPQTGGRDRYYGSRGHGFVSTSKNGPVRVNKIDQSGKVTEGSKTDVAPGPGRKVYSDGGGVYRDRTSSNTRTSPSPDRKLDDSPGSVLAPDQKNDSPRNDGSRSMRPDRAGADDNPGQWRNSPENKYDSDKFRTKPNPERNERRQDFKPHRSAPREFPQDRPRSGFERPGRSYTPDSDVNRGQRSPERKSYDPLSPGNRSEMAKPDYSPRNHGGSSGNSRSSGSGGSNRGNSDGGGRRSPR